MAVNASEITEKYIEHQMNLFKTEEWREYIQPGSRDVCMPSVKQ